uniref:Uncharacterized protein n=1 Tax=Setaria digitata TaxID=48799 RepID=A0A915PN92_9BILA
MKLERSRYRGERRTKKQSKRNPNLNQYKQRGSAQKASAVQLQMKGRKNERISKTVGIKHPNMIEIPSKPITVPRHPKWSIKKAQIIEAWEKALPTKRQKFSQPIRQSFSAQKTKKGAMSQSLSPLEKGESATLAEEAVKDNLKDAKYNSGASERRRVSQRSSNRQRSEYYSSRKKGIVETSREDKSNMASQLAKPKSRASTTETKRVIKRVAKKLTETGKNNEVGTTVMNSKVVPPDRSEGVPVQNMLTDRTAESGIPAEELMEEDNKFQQASAPTDNVQSTIFNKNGMGALENWKTLQSASPVANVQIKAGISAPFEIPWEEYVIPPQLDATPARNLEYYGRFPKEQVQNHTQQPESLEKIDLASTKAQDAVRADEKFFPANAYNFGEQKIVIN